MTPGRGDSATDGGSPGAWETGRGPMPASKESLLTGAKRCLATADSKSELVMQATGDEANKETPVFWPGSLCVPRPQGEA